MAVELDVRRGSPSVELTRDEFRERFRAQFVVIEIRNSMRVLVERARQLRAGVTRPVEGIVEPRPK